MTLTPPPPNSKAPDLQATREQVAELACKLWVSYVETERKSAQRIPWEIHNQIQSKIQKVTGGLTRLASRSKVKKDEGTRFRCTMSQQQAFDHTNIHMQLVK